MHNRKYYYSHEKDIIDIIKNYWIDNNEFTEERIKDIVDDIKGDNKKLAMKLLENKDIWLRNYKIMNLVNIDEDIKISKLN